MFDRFEDSLQVLRVILVSTLCLIGVLLLIYMFMDAKAYGLTSASSHNTASPLTGKTKTNEWFEASNPIIRSSARMAEDFKKVTATTSKGLDGSGRAIASATMKSGTFAARTVRSGIRLAGQGIASGITISARSTAKLFGTVSSSRLVNSIIKPSESHEVPVIDPESLTKYQTQSTATELPEAKAEPKSTAEVAAWPIHGRITTLFGVPHWPYQPKHTGLDISSGKPSGKTAVRAYLSGRVIETELSSEGLGNHVVIDHGDGKTSVYGHLDSIKVEAGQDVSQETIIGFEGTTGVSTGTHLHFEIRIFGDPVNPYKYVDGHP